MHDKGTGEDKQGWTLSLSLSLSLFLSCSLSRSRSLSLAKLVTPTTSTLVQDNTRLIPLLCSISHQPIWAGTRSDKFTPRSRDPPGPKPRQLARQVGACCVLTNTFPLSSRWVDFSNLFSPGRCSVRESRVHVPRRQLRHGTAPSAARRQRQSAHPVEATSTTTSPRGGRGTPGSSLPPSSPEETKTGQQWPRKRRHLIGCRTRASRRCRHSSGGHVGCCPRA
jgi:hypothetical protein